MPSQLLLHTTIKQQKQEPKKLLSQRCRLSAPGVVAAQHSGGGSGRKQWRQQKAVGGSIGSGSGGAVAVQRSGGGSGGGCVGGSGTGHGKLWQQRQ
jgi:hypothetical protein